MTTNRTPWTPAENAALVSLYFHMLDCAMTGEAYNKAQLIRVAQGVDNDYTPALANRSRGSIEAKLMNASAAHADLDPGAETMASHGYKAWGNYQATLKAALNDELNRRQSTMHDDCDGFYAARDEGIA
jgi:hypothetical protein